MPIGDAKNQTWDRYRTAVALLVILAIFTGLFLSIASRHALNSDEGIYGAAALRFADGDLLLQKADTDKPPLNYTLQGLSLALFGRSDISLKLPNLIALLFLIVLAYLMGRDYFGKPEGLLAAVLVATSPFVGLCGIGAMTDPPAAVFLLASLWAALRERSVACGFFFGMALLTRQMALLFLPITLIALVWDRSFGTSRWSAFRKSITPFLKGAAGPVAWLVIWSAFFERERFRWLWQELFSGKVTLGSQKADLIGRLGFWLGEIIHFPAFKGILLIAAACAVLVLFLRRGVRHKSGSEDLARGIPLLMAVVLVYYPLVHALMAVPLYRRMMFPALVPGMLLVSWAIGAAGRMMAERLGCWSRYLVWVILPVILIGGTVQVHGMLIEPNRYDDVPQVARLLAIESTMPSVVFSTDMNRELMFYLYNVPIKRKQFKGDPDKLREWAAQYPDRTLFLALRKSERELEPLIVQTLHPRYQVKRVIVSSRALITLYRIDPAAKFITIESGSAIQYNRDGIVVRKALTVEAVEDGLARYARRVLACESDPVVEVDPNEAGLTERGAFDRIRISADGPVLKGVRAQSLELVYDDVCIDLIKLLALEQLVVNRHRNAQARIRVAPEGITVFLRKKNPNLESLEFFVEQKGVSISGAFRFAGREASFVLKGGLSLGPEGEVSFHPKHGTLDGYEVPTFLLGLVERSINPAFVVRIDALGLTGREVAYTESQLDFLLR